jgi:hypothetical protein
VPVNQNIIEEDKKTQRTLAVESYKRIEYNQNLHEKQL